MWAALDCPGAFSFQLPQGTAMLLGELSVQLKGSIAAGERCVVIGWEFAHEGRKHHTGHGVVFGVGSAR
jgi:hypothetical protein